MALSNIFKEPRREITESMIGIGVLAIPVFADYKFAVWLASFEDGHGEHIPIFFGILIGIVILTICSLLLISSHALGDKVCDLLADRGLDPRPKRRR